MLPDKIEHCIVFMNYWDVSGVFWSFSKCNITIPHIPHFPTGDSTIAINTAITVSAHIPMLSRACGHPVWS